MCQNQKIQNTKQSWQEKGRQLLLTASTLKVKRKPKSKYSCPSEAKTRTACNEHEKDSVAESSEAEFHEKPEISEEKESMPSQSSDDNKEENKGSYVHLSSSLPSRNRENDREIKTTSAFLSALGRSFGLHNEFTRGHVKCKCKCIQIK